MLDKIHCQDGLILEQARRTKRLVNYFQSGKGPFPPWRASGPQQ